MADMTKTNKGRWLKLSKTLAYTLRSNTDGMTIEQFKTINWLPQWIVDMESWHIASFAMYDKQKDGANRFHLFTWTTYGEKECVNMEDLPNFPSLVKKVHMTAEPSVAKNKNTYYDGAYYAQKSPRSPSKKNPRVSENYGSFDQRINACVVSIPVREVPFKSFGEWAEAHKLT